MDTSNQNKVIENSVRVLSCSSKSENISVDDVVLNPALDETIPTF